MCVGLVAEELKYESLITERGRQTTTRFLTGEFTLQNKLIPGNKIRSGKRLPGKN